MENYNNAVWQKSMTKPNLDNNNSITADSLEEAAKIVMISNELKYAFRRNKEIFDFNGRFRHFKYNDCYFVIKIYNDYIPREYTNILKANQLLKNETRYYVPVPLLINYNNKYGLVYKDYGYTLHQNVEMTKTIPLKEIVNWFTILLSHGIEWAGFLPRNIMYNNNKIILIDWEDVVFNNGPCSSISDLTLFKMILGWSQVYGSINIVKEAFEKCLTGTYISLKDDFETTYGDLLNITNVVDIRKKASKISFDSESPSQSSEKTNLSFMEIGHIVDDLFNTRISVLYSCCTAKIRNEKGDNYFSCFSKAFENILCLALRENNTGLLETPIINLRKTILLFLLYFFQQPSLNDLYSIQRISSHSQFENYFKKKPSISSNLIKFILCNQNGIQNANYRSIKMQEFLFDLFEIIKTYVIGDNELFLLLRGSCAHGLMTTKSDVDFEVSGRSFPNGHNTIEMLISDILNVFEIKNEGSEGRPKEKDIIFDNSSRDYHEWIELTSPNSKTYDKAWLYNSIMKKNNNVNKWSEYETKNNCISTKYLFFRIRALILRLVLKNNISSSSYYEQINELKKYYNPKTIEEITKTIEEILNMYETEETSCKKILHLYKKIDTLYECVNLKMTNN